MKLGKSKRCLLVLVFLIICASAFFKSEVLATSSVGTVEDFVERLYREALNREPDAAGLQDWSWKLHSRKITGTKAAEGFIFSTEFINKNLSNSAYLDVLYETFLGRSADVAGKNSWLKQLDNSVSREFVFKGFAESKEFTEICAQYGIDRGGVQLSSAKDQNANVTMFVNRNYRLCLNREPDDGGLNQWCSQINSGQSTAKVVAYGFVFSQEFLGKNVSDEAYVNILYRLFLDREADAAGLKSWVDALGNGNTRVHVLNGFADSVEFQSLCRDYGINSGSGISIGNESGATGSSSSGALHVQGTKLVNASGQPVQLKGFSTHGLAWFPQYINAEFFKQMHDEWNVNVVRLAMYTEEYGGYCSGGNQENLKNLIRNGVKYAADAGMYAIVDWHILSDGNPNTHLNDAKSFFDQMAREFAGYDHVLYEICNEPNGGTSWGDIKSYAEQIIPVIRAHDSDAVIIVGTPNWSQYVDQAVANPIKGYDNIMYALHFYADTHRDDLRNKMVNAINQGLPIFVTEYGICDASGNGAINAEQANQWIQTMNQYGISYVAWNISNKNETSSIISSSCSKTSGFAYSDLSACGQWLYNMLKASR